MARRVKILTCNVGSTSLRMGVLQRGANDCFEVLGEFHGRYDRLDDAFAAMSRFGPFERIAHRVVHAGLLSLGAARPFDHAVESAVEEARPLAPDHNAAALHVVRRCRDLFPDALEFAVFDSHFFATLPPAAVRYALPAPLVQKYGIRRYGFHGLSHAYSAQEVAKHAPTARAHVSVHAGGGVSLAAIENGTAVDTTMGLTPLEGPVMAKRCGSIDPGVMFALHRGGMTMRQIEHVLAHESGLFALSESSADYDEVAKRAVSGDGVCALALQIYHQRIAQEVARMAVSLGGLDVLSFTGGVGENAEGFRAAICTLLGFLGAAAHAPVVVRSREDVMLARAAAAVPPEPGP